MSEPVPLHARLSRLRPNWRLKAAREQRGWSQQELADRLNITPNTVSRWERGMSSPGPYLRRQLCDLLGKSAEELGLLSRRPAANSERFTQSHQVSRSPALPIWNVPFQRNPFFTGREQELLHLHQRLHPGKNHKARTMQALCGLAGMGKTQTAVEYCYRFYEEYQAVLWARAETSETLLADFATIAELLALPGHEEHDQQRAVEAVKGWLRAHRDWLLILDNIEDLSLLQRVVPPIHQGHILLTMRAQATGNMAESLDLGKMDTSEGALFLLRRTKSIPRDAEVDDAAPTAYASALEIARLLDGLPLALDQAGAYIEETACSFADYIERYRSQRATLLTLRGTLAADHPASVAATLSLIIERVEALHPEAADLLRLCAFLQPDAIPESMIIEGVAEGCYLQKRLTRDPYIFDAAIKTLRDFSLIQRNAESKALSLHRLVQAMLQDRLDEVTRRQRVQWTVELVSQAFPDPKDDASWPRCQQYLPQALTCAALIEEWEVMTHDAGRLLLRAGTYLLHTRQRAQAEDLLLRARDILLHTVGEQHADYAQCLNDLGLLYHYQGKYVQAGELYQQALSIREQSYVTEQEPIAESLNNLGGLYYERGRYAQAEVLLRRALEMWEKLRGPESMQVVTLLHNIGGICLMRGKYEQAEPLLQKAAALVEKLLGPEHPRTLNCIHYLAMLYTSQKRYTQAESLHRQVLALQEKLLGAEHAHVGFTLHCLAQLYHEQGHYAQAEELYRRALAVRERALGPQHPQTAQTLNDLARLLLEQGRDDEAVPLYQRSLAIRESKLGSEHPDYAASLATLAQLCEHREENEKAIQLYQQALSIWEGALAPEHPLVIRCHAAYSRLLAREAARQSATTGFAAQEHPAEAEEQTSLASAGESALLDTFLAACCERHPRAWCRAADLWSAYQRWSEQQGERFPLSRRAFAEALKQRGYRPDRTNEYRIWRGLALRSDLL